MFEGNCGPKKEKFAYVGTMYERGVGEWHLVDVL